MNENKGTIILVLGILGLTGCLAILAPVAWVMGNSYRRECIVEGREPDKKGNIGRTLGMVGTLLWILLFLCSGVGGIVFYFVGM